MESLNFDMANVDKSICRPAFVYLVIALIMMFVGMLLNFRSVTMGASFMQLCSIVLCTLVLMGLCNVAPEISWAITIIFIVCTVIGIIGTIMNWISPQPMMNQQHM